MNKELEITKEKLYTFEQAWDNISAIGIEFCHLHLTLMCCNANYNYKAGSGRHYYQHYICGDKVMPKIHSTGHRWPLWTKVTTYH